MRRAHIALANFIAVMAICYFISQSFPQLTGELAIKIALFWAAGIYFGSLVVSLLNKIKW